MQGLIGDRFLKRFFGSRLHQHKIIPFEEVMTSSENGGEVPARSGALPQEQSQGHAASQAIKQLEEDVEFFKPENGMDRL